ncbi:MAG: FAD-dependent oxidoreductase [Geminicoccaceae bacterium]|nr:FAD-dependent oxidoreductase [Geminicoccaceae bacterium]
MAEGFKVGRLDDLAPGALRQAEAGGRELLLARVGDRVFATDARCTHYGAPLAEGVLVGGRVICPWHHAVFDVATGGHDEPPGCGGLRSYPVRVEAGEIVVEVEGAAAPAEPPIKAGKNPVFVIVGAGAAGSEAAFALRREGFEGRIVLVGREEALPYDRTVLSKEVLRGEKPPRPLDLWPGDFYAARGIELWLGREVRRVDAAQKRVAFADGTGLDYDACLVATGGVPRRLDVPGADLEGVLTLRSRADAGALVAAARNAERAVVVGASFIGLECAASLAARGVEVTVAAPDDVPFAKVFGEAVGRALVRVHEAKGVAFRLGRQAVRFEGDGEGAREGGARVAAAVLDDGERLAADLVVVGVGIAPATGILCGVGLDDDGGVPVDAGLRAADGLWAAGDVAKFPLPDGTRVRIEHWRLAREHGRVAALSMMGRPARYEGVPFFWSAQHLALYYVGHAEGFDDVALDGRPGDGPFIAYYLKDGRVKAALGVERNADMAALQGLMRLGAAPDAAEVRQGGFAPAERLRRQALRARPRPENADLS